MVESSGLPEIQGWNNVGSGGGNSYVCIYRGDAQCQVTSGCLFWPWASRGISITHRSMYYSCYLAVIVFLHRAMEGMTMELTHIMVLSSNLSVTEPLITFFFFRPHCSACGTLISLQWKRGVLTTGLPGKDQPGVTLVIITKLVAESWRLVGHVLKRAYMFIMVLPMEPSHVNKSFQLS